jgi:hypothetical protein
MGSNGELHEAWEIEQLLDRLQELLGEASERTGMELSVLVGEETCELRADGDCTLAEGNDGVCERLSAK